MKQIYDDLKLVLLLVMMIPLSSLFGQNATTQSDTANYPFWTQMMQDPNANFYATQSAFYKYWANRNTKVKGKGYKIFKRWEYINEFRVKPDGRLQPPGYVKRIYEEYSRNLLENDLKNATCDWSLIGPTALPANSTVQPNGMGRINAIAFHPTNANIIYIGSPSGGIWKTTDGGATWTDLSSNMPTLGVSAILIHPSNPNTIYIGSGDRDSDDAPGLGVFKSTNGGATWVQINNSMGNARVGALAMSPADPDIIIAATNMGLYRTADGGNTWSQRLTSSLWKDVKFKPGDPNIVYAAWGGVLYRSTNAGVNWSSVTLPATGSRIVIGVSPANPSYVYLAQTNTSDGTFEGLMRSTDSGATFTLMSNTPNIYGYQCDGSDDASQAFYDLCINVDPTNANTLYVGGINIWKSTDGGVNWNINSHWVGSSFSDPCLGAPSVHADQHALEWSPVNGRLYSGNDGGIYWTSDGGTNWNDISSGLAIAQVYKISQSATNQSLVLHGYQDNGTSLSNNSSFTTVGGGDGFECIIDYSNSNVRFITFPYGDMSRSTGGGYSTVAGEGSNGITESGAFSAPFMQHVTDPNTLFGGYKNVWRTNNAKASPASSVTWSAISTGESTTCRVIQQSTADPNVLYVVRSGSLQRTDNANATAASVTWTTCTLPDGFTPADIETHPSNPNIVYAAAGNGVYKSTDKGASWTNISGSLPALFVNCLVYDKNTNEGLYVGNQAGIWYKDATMSDWMTYNASLPIVDIREIEIYYDAANRNNERVKAATYGRGTWENKLLSSPPVLNCASISAVNLTPNAAGCTNSTDLTPPVAVDNCDGNIIGAGSRSDSAPINDSWPLGMTTVTWTFTDGAGSTHQCSQTVTVTNNLTPIITGPTSVCSGGSVTLGTSTSYSAYAWSDGGGTGSTATYSNIAGPLTVSVTVTDANGCTGTDSHSVSVNAGLSPIITGPTSVCSGGSVTLGTSTSYNSYSWSNGGGTGSTATYSNITGPLTVSVTVTDANGCTGTDSHTVSVNAGLSPTITGPTSVCSGGSVTLGTSTSYSAYAWSNGGGTGSTATYSNIAGPLTVSVTVTDANGCTGTDSHTVNISAIPTPVITGDMEVCSGGNVLLDAGVGYSSYAWSNGGGSGQTAIFSNITNTTTFTVTVTNASGCSGSDTHVVEIASLPCGWSWQPNGINCANGNSVDYNANTQEFTLTSTNCYYGNPFTNDAMAFAQRTICGNGSIMAEVTSISGGLGWAGIVMRESNAGGAKKVQLMTNLNSLIKREVRYTTNGPAYPQQFPMPQRYWLYLLRQGNQFVGYVSTNGDQWSQVMSVTVSMNSCIEAGLVLSNYQQSGSITATFANVNVTNGGGNLAVPENVNELDAIEWENVIVDFNVFPNPTAGVVNVDLTAYSGRALRLEVYSLEGQLQHFMELPEAQTIERLDLSTFPSGLYLVKVKSEGLPDLSKRLILK